MVNIQTNHSIIYLIKMKILFVLKNWLKYIILIRRVKKNFSLYIKGDKNFHSKFEAINQDANIFHNELLDAYCKSNGKICNDLQKEIEIKFPASIKESQIISSIWGEVNLFEIDKLIGELNSNGYAAYKDVLPDSYCDELYDLASNIPFTTAVDNFVGNKIDFNNIKGEVCVLNNNDILASKAVQKLIVDELFITVAEKYFKSQVIFDFPAMWWSFPYIKRDNMESAQFFHFDFDRIKWLKVFIYLTDVNFDNGPHVYIKKSHSINNKPNELLKLGYKRIRDSDMLNYYSEEEIITVCGRRGLVLFGDTKCWHKGNPLVSGHRLILEFQYSSSLYGARIKGLKMNLDENINIEQLLTSNPNFFNNLDIS